MNKIVKAENLAKEYALAKGVFRVFEGLDFELEEGDFVAIMGVSGVGKTTLLNLLGALDVPSRGRIELDGEDLLMKNKKELARIRNEKIGFVFQFYHLLPEFSALENAAFPLLIKGVKKEEAFEKSLKILKEVSLGDKTAMKPRQLSGGEQQRIAIARALINEPRLLLADEPTGNLDWKSGSLVMDLLQELHQRKKLSSVIVTHNEKVARLCKKLFLMDRGELKLLSSL